MVGFTATKIDDFTVTVDCSLLIFTTMMSQMTFHQPCFRVIRVNVQYSVDEDFGDFPSFF